MQQLKVHSFPFKNFCCFGFFKTGTGQELHREETNQVEVLEGKFLN